MLVYRYVHYIFNLLGKKISLYNLNIEHYEIHCSKPTFISWFQSCKRFAIQLPTLFTYFCSTCMYELTQMPNPITTAKYPVKTNMSVQCRATLVIAVAISNLNEFYV